MPVRLRRVETLAKEISKTTEETTKILSARGITVIDGYYDRALFEALYNEPSLLTKKRTEWGLSHRLGLGAVKYILDPLGIRIIVHDCRGSQWLMLRRDNKNVLIRWQYANTFTSATWCVFSVRNFLRANAPAYYLFTCFEGPHAWVVPTKTLTTSWNAIKDKKEVADTFALADGLEEHEGGALVVSLDSGASKFELKTQKQLGF